MLEWYIKEVGLLCYSGISRGLVFCVRVVYLWWLVSCVRVVYLGGWSPVLEWYI